MRLSKKAISLLACTMLLLALVGIAGGVLAADSDQACIERIRAKVELEGVTAKEITLADGNLRVILDASGLTVKEPTPVVLYRLKRAVAEEAGQGVKWLDYGFVGGDVYGQEVRPIQVMKNLSSAEAGAKTAAWLSVMAMETGVKTTSSFQDYCLTVTADGSSEQIATFAEKVMNGGVVLFEKGQLNSARLIARCDGRVVYSAIYDYQLGERLAYRDPTMKIDF